MQNYAPVAIVPCDTYDLDAVTNALNAALAAIDGLAWVTPGMRVVIKANLVTFLHPETAATTHPSVVCALTKLLVERGAVVTIGDSPGGTYGKAYLNRVYQVCGMTQAVAFGAALNQDFSTAKASYPEAMVMHEFEYTAFLDDADAIIDVCKLKSHGMMALSAAAKNMFGVIPGTLKPEYHYRFPNSTDFARMILDLNNFFKPRLSICDAIIGMEGNGPTMGTPKKIGCILCSESPHALDLAGAHIINLPPARVPTLTEAMSLGYIPEDIGGLTILGELESLRVADYKHVEQHNSVLFGGKVKGIPGYVIQKVSTAALASKPVVLPKKCVGCAVCQKTCPANAIKMKNKIPRFRRGRCILCFCCQEFCPKGALVVKRPGIARVFMR
ncbi:MAG: DUF362 domain-containing protein [Clostridiales bacterium]|nr:DUF362 domain-containing protein [Clostridiales bacterium]